MSGEPVLPGIDACMCVHAHAPFARCEACAAACPKDAILLDDDGLSLDPTACDGCGLCVPACPRAAITLQRPLTILFAGRRCGSAWATCREVREAGETSLACQHALGHRDLDSLAEEGVHALHILSGDCADCPNGAGPQQLENAHARHVAIRKSRGAAVVQLVLYREGDAYRAALARARVDTDEIDRRRRRLFSALSVPERLPETEASEALAYHSPLINTAFCVACDACTGICPDGALVRERLPQSAYRIVPSRCSGCQLCLDLCDREAISLQEAGPAGETVLRLDPGRCRSCGVPYYRLQESGSGRDGLCRICAVRPHAGNLFQVLSGS